MTSTPRSARPRLQRLSPTVPLGIVLVLIALTLAGAVACPADAQAVVHPGDEFQVMVPPGKANGPVTIHTGDGGIATVEPGEHFGEIALLERVHRTAAVRALEPALALCFSRAALEQRPALAMKLYRNMTRILSKRLRRTNNEVLLEAQLARQAEQNALEYEQELKNLVGKLRH